MALAAWRSGRMLVFDQRTFPVLTSIVGKLSTRPTQPFFVGLWPGNFPCPALDLFIFSFFLLHFLFVPCAGLSWLSIIFLLHVKTQYRTPLPVLCRIVSYHQHSILVLQLTGDHLCGQRVHCRSANQADSAFYLFGIDKWVVGCN